jgi:hypothetical protein
MRVIFVSAEPPELPKFPGTNYAVEKTYWYDEKAPGIRLPETHQAELDALLRQLDTDAFPPLNGLVEIDTSSILVGDSQVDTYEILGLFEDGGGPPSLERVVAAVDTVFQALKNFYGGGIR